MAKFLRVNVTRTESTDLYIEVPDDFDEKLLRWEKFQASVAQAADETTAEHDWGDSEWMGTVEVQSIAVVDESEAKKHHVALINESDAK